MSIGGEDPPPKELVVDAKPAPGDSSSASGTAMAPVAVTVMVAGAIAKLVSPTAGVVAFGAAIVVLLLRRKPDDGRFVLRVEGGVLDVRREKRPDAPVRVALADLLEVTLERKTRPADGRGGTAADRVRIALERRAPEEPIFVPDERITAIEAQEWHRNVRVFLRKHGWVPEDERTETDVT